MKPREGAQQGREPLAGRGDRLWGQGGSEEAASTVQAGGEGGWNQAVTTRSGRRQVLI